MEAKREVQKSNPNVQLKNDPTAGMDLQNPPPAAPKVYVAYFIGNEQDF